MPIASDFPCCTLPGSFKMYILTLFNFSKQRLRTEKLANCKTQLVVCGLPDWQWLPYSDV